jgi:large subunit ribosomal protein L13
MKQQKTYYAKEFEIDKKWWIIDAKNQVLGRVATQIASIAKGKTKVSYTPSMDTGDYVIVINADKVLVTGNKQEKKTYYSHSMYPGGLKSIVYKDLMKKKPVQVLYNAVRGMLPKNKIGRKMIKNVKFYAGDTHPHEAQMPKSIVLSQKKGG